MVTNNLVPNLIFKVIFLGLILSAHFSLVSLIWGNNWAQLFFRTYPTELLLSALALSAAYIVSFFIFRPLDEKETLQSWLLYLLLTISVACLLYAIFYLTQDQRHIIASTVLFISFAVFLAFCHTRLKEIKSLQYILGIALLILGLTPFYLYHSLIFHPKTPLTILSGENKFKIKESVRGTDFYPVYITQYYMSDYIIPARISNTPSYIDALDNKNFLVIDRYGNIYHLTLKKEEGVSSKESLYIKKLTATLPTNYQALYSSAEGKNIIKPFFRVHDIYIESENKSGKKQALYVSHHFWNAEKKCITLRLSKLIGDATILLSPSPSPEWHTLYETTPCFPSLVNGKPFGGHRSGGRIVGMDEENLLLSVGDQGYLAHLSQDTTASYGKIWKINRTTGAASLISIGHRNPQGLYHAPDGSIWETEHGPASGDELNKIKTGANYGWPHVLYGTSYGQYIYSGPPPQWREIMHGTNYNHQNDHGEYEHPIFAWTPAIAVSNLIGVEGNLFPLWKNNLLVSSLKNKALFRLQMHDDRVIYSERIKIGQRIRDLIQTPNGEIFIWTDSQNLFRLRAQNPLAQEELIGEVGKHLFRQKCIACHDIKKPRLKHGIGPSLYGVYKNRIASHSDYHYSPALQSKLQSRWTHDNLDFFLKNPEIFASGTTMLMKIPDDYERRALLHYLKNQ